jgi:hypothetical protein
MDRIRKLTISQGWSKTKAEFLAFRKLGDGVAEQNNLVVESRLAMRFG